MKHTRILLTALMMMALLPAAAVFGRNGGEISPRDPAEAYLALVRGDEARDAEDLHAAIAAYEDARVRYARIAKAHPDWESDIVQYRLLYCETQIKAAREKMGPVNDAEQMVGAPGGEPPAYDDEAMMGADAIAPAAPAASAVAQPAADPAPQAVEDAYQKRYLAVQQENEYLRRRLDELMSAAAEESPAASGGGSADADRLRTELAEAARRAQDAEAKVRELEGQVRELAREVAARSGREESGAPAASDAARSDAKYRDWMRDALTREKAGDFKAALDLYERILDKYSSDATAAKGQGRCLIAIGQPDKAASALRKLAPALGDAELIVLLGAAYGRSGKFRESAEAVRPLVATDPWNARARGVLGAALIGLGDLEAARAELEKAIVLDPQLPDACLNLAGILSGLGPEEREKGRELYRRSIELGGAPDRVLEQRFAQP